MQQHGMFPISTRGTETTGCQTEAHLFEGNLFLYEMKEKIF